MQKNKNNCVHNVKRTFCLNERLSNMQEVVSTSVPDTLGKVLFLKMLDSIGQKLILHWLHDQTEGASESLKTA